MKKNSLNKILLLKQILLQKRDTLPRRKFASRSKDGISPTSHAVSSLADSSSLLRGIVLQHPIFPFVLLPAFFLLLLEVRAFEADRFTRLNFSLIKVRWESSSSCHCCPLFDRTLTSCSTKCWRPVPRLLYALWCHRYRCSRLNYWYG